MRSLFEFTSRIPNIEEQLIHLCVYIAEWCTNEKRSFLRHRIETRQADLLFRLERYNDALELLKRLLHEIKKLDDKALQVEIQLIES